MSRLDAVTQARAHTHLRNQIKEKTTVQRQPPLKMSSSQKVEETLNRINTHMGVLGVIIVNKKGVAIKSTMKQDETINNGS